VALAASAPQAWAHTGQSGTSEGVPEVGDAVQIEPDWDLAAQPAPDDEVDQRITW
jgi:hypothetical protein